MQDALASLVAAEMKRQLRRELAPIAPQKMVTVHDAEELDELRRLQVRGAWRPGGGDSSGCCGVMLQQATQAPQASATPSRLDS